VGDENKNRTDFHGGAMVSKYYIGIGVIVVILVVILLGIIFFIPTYSCLLGQECKQGISTVPSQDNLIPAQTKISTDLLQLTDSSYLSKGVTEATLEQQMVQNHQLTYADGKTFVYVYIQLNASSNPTSLDSLVWNVTNSDPANHLVVAWVDVNNLMNLASLESVESIRTVYPPALARG
jgi:hypothetical protein